MDFTDKITLDGLRKTADGYLVAEARVARTGIQEYRGYEVGKPDQAVIRVYRPEAEVFARDAMHSYAHRPLTLDHPSDPVTAETWKDVSIGQTGDEVVRDGEFVRVPLVVMDAKAIEAIGSGKRELSMGYSAELDWTDGETEGGEKYDAIQTNLRMNHLAVVAKARGGSQLKIGDGNNGGRTMTDKNRTISVDGLSVELTDSAAQIVEKGIKSLEQQVSDGAKALTDAETKAKAEIAAKDAEIAKKDAEIDALKAKVLDEAALDARVAARADLVAKAAVIAKDVATTGKSDAEIRKAVVAAKLGDKAIEGKSAEYIDARFDILAESAANVSDPMRDAFAGGLKVVDAGDGWSDAMFAKAGVKMKKGA